MRPIALVAALCLGWVVAATLRADSTRIEVEALFTDAAVLEIDGESKMLRVGQSFRGVSLLAAYSQTATVEANGRQMVLGLSRLIGANYQEPSERVVTITRDAIMQYRTMATSNGRHVAVLVDTAANVVAMND